MMVVLSCWLNSGTHAYLCDDCRKKGHRFRDTKAVAWGKEPQDEPCSWCGRFHEQRDLTGCYDPWGLERKGYDIAPYGQGKRVRVLDKWERSE